MKIQRISEFQHKFSFLSSVENFEAYYARFLESDLGKIYSAIPWSDLVKKIGLKEAVKGAKMSFSPKGRIALMFLKYYGCCSDRRLIEQLNGNIDYQFFCDFLCRTLVKLHIITNDQGGIIDFMITSGNTDDQLRKVIARH